VKIYVHLGHGLDSRAYAKRFKRGLEPDRSPYGFGLAAQDGADLVFSADHAESPSVKFCRRLLRRLIGFDLLHAWRNRHRWADCDVIWTVQESEWLAISCLQHLGVRRPALIGNSIWLFNLRPRLGWLQRKLAAHLARRVEVLTVHADAAAARAAHWLGNRRPELLMFGICRETFQPRSFRPRPAPANPSAAHPLRLLVPGNDRSRDWDTLVEAFGDDARFEVVVVSSTVNAKMLARHPRIRKVRVRGMKDLLNLYGWCDCVVIPMVANDYAGITVALEATAMARPVIAARTGGVPTYLADDEAFWYEPGNAQDLVRCAAAPDAAQRQRVVASARTRWASSDFSTQGMVQRYRAFTAQALADVGGAGRRA